MIYFPLTLVIVMSAFIWYPLNTVSIPSVLMALVLLILLAIEAYR